MSQRVDIEKIFTTRLSLSCLRRYPALPSINFFIRPYLRATLLISSDLANIPGERRQIKTRGPSGSLCFWQEIPVNIHVLLIFSKQSYRKIKETPSMPCPSKELIYLSCQISSTIRIMHSISVAINNQICMHMKPFETLHHVMYCEY